MRLIDADALWEELGILYHQNNGKATWNDALMEIKTAPTIEPDTDMVSRKFMHDLGATCIARRDEGDDLVAILSIDLLPPASESNAPKTLDDNCLSPTKEANTSDRSIN